MGMKSGLVHENQFSLGDRSRSLQPNQVTLCPNGIHVQILAELIDNLNALCLEC